MIDVCDPVADPGAPVQAYELAFRIEARPAAIGMVSNGFTDAAVFLRDLEDELRGPTGIEFRRIAKPSLRHSSFTWSDQEIESIASDCDAVITAYGHCGSCTSALVRDAAALARAGTPVVSIVTAKFEDEARFVARAAGIPSLPLVVVPHPVAGRPEAYQRSVAATIASAVLEALSGPRVPV